MQINQMHCTCTDSFFHDWKRIDIELLLTNFEPLCTPFRSYIYDALMSMDECRNALAISSIHECQRYKALPGVS